jgi:putative acetyltransferase
MAVPVNARDSTMIEIHVDDPARADISALLDEHLADMYRTSPPESVHALGITALRRPDVTFWSARIAGELVGCGALKELDASHGEIKSMRTADAHRRHGVARAVLEHIIAEARRRRYRRLSLETGSMAAFIPARELYERFGFTCCPPFASYAEDPNSVFLTLNL